MSRHVKLLLVRISQRFADGQALASYVGIIPREYSSGERQRLGGLGKQGSPLLRFLWGEAGTHAARRDPDLQSFEQTSPFTPRSGLVRFVHRCIDDHGSLVIFRSVSVPPIHLFDQDFDHD